MCAIGLGCAEIAPPPGGEVDTIGPTLVSSEPADGTLEVDSLESISMTFSERLLKPNKGSGVFISPRPMSEPEIKWGSDRIDVVLTEPLVPNQTYVISVSSDVTDLRRNRLDSGITIAFSTGAYIDSGSASGTVLTSADKPAAGWAVGLYRDMSFPDSESSDSTYPDYLTNCDPQGKFALQYLPPGDFRLLAFNDGNRDELFNPEVEAFAVPDRQFTIGADLQLDDLILTGTEYDSLDPKILSAVSTADGLVRIRLSRSLDPAWLGQRPGRLRLISIVDSSSHTAEAILEAADVESSILTAYVPSMTEGLYGLTVEYSEIKPPLSHDSVQIRSLEDNAAPTYIKMEPVERRHFAHAVNLIHTYSEPIDTSRLSAGTFSLWKSDSLFVPTTLQWRDRFHLILTPERISPATRYRLDISEFDIVDLAGNRLGDSVKSLTFSTHDADSLGSVAGTVLALAPLEQEASAHLTLQLAGTDRLFEVEAKPHRASADGQGRLFSLVVPPGDYLLRGFLDRNNDGSFSPGGIRPFRFSETRSFYSDTISVRARFETAGIEFNID